MPQNEQKKEQQTKKNTAVQYTKVSSIQASKASSMISPKSQEIRSFMDYAVPLERSIAYLKRKKTTDTVLTLPNRAVSIKTLLETAQLLQKLLPHLDENPNLLAEHFDWYTISPTILYTGYYEPFLNASRKQTKKYKYPIYATPRDLRVLQLGVFNPTLQGKRIMYRVENGYPVPYYSREDIDSKGVLKNKNLEIAWTDSAVDIFFLQIQGSGRLRYDTGEESYILYAAQSGRPYKSLGSVMVQRGLLKPGNVNMQTIREWLYANPKHVQALLNTNESYVFFKEAKEGPFGSIAQKLTPWQSIAVDPTVIPYGAIGVGNIALLDKIQYPPQGAVQSRTISGLLFAQDTGGAIKNNRIDLFCGPSDEAVSVSGFLAGRNPFWILLKKETSE